MKKLLVLGALFVALALPGTASAGEVDLATYLRMLRVAPGNTIEQKIDRLTSLGITLSDQGPRELEHTAATQEKAPTRPPRRAALPAWSPYSYDSTSSSQSDDDVAGSLQYQRYSPRPLPRRTVPVRPTSNGYGTSGTSARLGGTTFYNFDDGTSGTANRLGNTTFYNFSDGTSGTANRLGNTTYYNDNKGLSGTTNQIGGFGFHNLNNGVSGTSTQVGGFTFHNFSNGRNCTTNRIGSHVYTNCY